ncbi:redoxin family protein [Massilia sp. DD77]|uniref:redoxin family protein n=1 Tax=Massilia sp. DD77 TaxID=3109349 RepID=UPI002FFFE49E
MKTLFSALAGAALLSGVAAAAPAATLPVLGPSPGFERAGTWLNSAPLTRERLRGKVVLVDFWTYSCINCIRTLPYVRAWAEKYRSHGLEVVGVHTPEFEFEEDLANVNAAMRRFRIDFPVAVDSSRQIWRAWGNRYWPAYYLVDAAGQVRYRQFGEGDYASMERAIQSLLAETRGGATVGGLVDPATQAEQMAPSATAEVSGETYIGFRKAEKFHSPEALLRDAPQRYSVPALQLNQWALSGRWVVGAEFGRAAQAGAGIVYRFGARDLHLVAGGEAGRPVRIKVTLDGRVPGADHGADIDAEGNGVIAGARLYQLIRQSGAVRQRRFEVRFLDEGARAYAFTFG